MHVTDRPIQSSVDLVTPHRPTETSGFQCSLFDELNFVSVQFAIAIKFSCIRSLSEEMTGILTHIPSSILEQLIDLSPMAVAVFRDNLLVWRNRAAARMFGDFSNGDVTSEELATRLIPNPLMRETLLAQARARSVDTDREFPVSIPIELQRADGALVQCEISTIRMANITLLFVSLPSSFQYTSEIVSETHKMAALGRLAQGMAHEINNPLAAIGQNMQLILQRLLMNTERNQRIAMESGTTLDAIERYVDAQQISEKFDAVLTGNLRVGKIVHEMMAFAPSDDSHQYLPQNVSDLLDQALFLAKRDFFQHTALALCNIEIVMSLEKDLPDVVCQAWKITQAFFAIIKNATEAIHKKHPDAKGGRLSIHAWQQQGAVKISFDDNGTGMPEEMLGKIFEPYFTTKPGNLGTGLGLASCYYVIHQEHFGEIDVQSVQNEGSMFTVSLPVNRSILSSMMPSNGR
ncbi:MAG: PAS domain-containing protein [Deltaproteobacteria bacterium]|nr:PAS domain-containing protein [Deltaproteobacteria bacterium]